MSGWFKVSFAVLAACALSGMLRAGQATAEPATLDYRPAPRSALVSSSDARFVVARSQRGAESTTVLARQEADSRPRPVAWIVQLRDRTGLFVSIRRWPASSAPGEEAAEIEQLYSLVFRLDPEGRYCLADERTCDPTRDGIAHAEVLRALAATRERVTDRVQGAATWLVVEMREAATRLEHAEVVAARVVVSQDLPLEGATIYFNRAPHSLCAARTGTDGVATCQLVDPHGDEHGEDHTTSVTATFPGKVQGSRVLLPTTHVLSVKP